jgi:hypothetical protein
MTFKQFLLAVLLILAVFVIVSLILLSRKPTGPAAPTPTAGAAVTLPGLAIATVLAGLPDYDRDDWRHWTDDDGDCQDARQEVLIAESLQPVAFTDELRCAVASGLWISTYDGARFTTPLGLDIDHMVPLANAHRSGGWAWDAARKQRYANHADYAGHLVAVSASANRAKADKGPDEWRPPDRSGWCGYATDWVRVKAAWGLTATPSEWTALQDMLGTCKTPVRIGDTVVPAQTPGSKPTPATPDNLLYDPSGPDRDCGDFPTWQAAQAFYVAAGGPGQDPHRLDPDTDGLACETLPGAP